MFKKKYKNYTSRSMKSHSFLKNKKEQGVVLKNRIIFVAYFLAVLFSILLIRLIYLQVIHYQEYNTKAEQNRISLEFIAPTRGKIYSRNNKILATNVSVFYLEFSSSIDNLADTLLRLKKILPNLKDEKLEELKKKFLKNKKYKYITLLQALTKVELAKFAAHSFLFPKIKIASQQKRYYPNHESASHVIGHLGSISKKMQNSDKLNYKGISLVGKTGIENFYETQLKGEPGYKKVEVNVFGKNLDVLSVYPPMAGKDIYTSIDLNLQEYAEDLIADKRASIVAIDPSNGDVLTLASSPGFDPNIFVFGISYDKYQNLLQDVDKPFLNRALKGLYPPASILKIPEAIVALEQGYIDSDYSIIDKGYLKFKDRIYRDWKLKGHGEVNIAKAIKVSSDTFFYNLALKIGISDMNRGLKNYFGFGEETEIDLPSESKGLLPTPEWKEKTLGLKWYTGQTIISFIGQGYNLVTAMQLAKMTATVANKGLVVRPRINLAREIKATQLPIKNIANWELVANAMGEVLKPGGTAHHIGKLLSTYGIEAAGKTGTAQVFNVRTRDYEGELAEKLQDHSLFIAYAPFDKPKIAIAVIVENAGGGSGFAANFAARIIIKYLANNKLISSIQ